MVLVIVMLSAHTISNSSMVKQTSSTGLLTVITLDLESMEHAALRWISGRPTQSLMHTLPILATLKVSTNVKVPRAVTAAQARDTKEYATKMAVTSTPTEMV